MDGFEVTAGFSVDEGSMTVTLEWIGRVFVDEPDGGLSDHE